MLEFAKVYVADENSGDQKSHLFCHQFFFKNTRHVTIVNRLNQIFDYSFSPLKIFTILAIPFHTQLLTSE